jgi:hypothetical protein
MRCKKNGRCNAFEILQHIVVRESDDAISARCKPRVAPFVVAYPRSEVMTFAIDFDDEAARVRHEVNDICPYRLLPPKSQAA